MHTHYCRSGQVTLKENMTLKKRSQRQNKATNNSNASLSLQVCGRVIMIQLPAVIVLIPVNFNISLWCIKTTLQSWTLLEMANITHLFQRASFLHTSVLTGVVGNESALSEGEGGSCQLQGAGQEGCGVWTLPICPCPQHGPSGSVPRHSTVPAQREHKNNLWWWENNPLPFR